MRRRRIVGGVLAVLAVGCVGGCGASPRLQRQELATLERTCQSLYERSHDQTAPRIPLLFLRTWLSEPPHGFSGNTTRDEMHAICDDLPARPLVPPGRPFGSGS